MTTHSHDATFRPARNIQAMLLPTIAIALSLSLTGCREPNTFVPPPPPQVTVDTPQQIDATFFVDFPGRTAAFESVDVRARIKGFLRNVNFRDGQDLNVGDLLFEIEPETYQAAVETAIANVAQAVANLKLEDATLQRREQAFKTQAVSELDVIDAQARKSVAEAQLSAAKAALKQAELDLSYTQVTAPIAGRAARRLVSVGNLVGGGEATLLTQIVVVDPLYIFFNVDERTALRIFRKEKDEPSAVDTNKTMKVYIELADGEMNETPAFVDYADPDFDPSTGTILVRAVMQNEDRRLLPGLFSRVQIPHERKNAIVVPETSISRDMIGPYLLVVNDDNSVKAHYVELGPTIKEGRIIDSGIEATSRIIVEGLQRARDGITVTPKTAQPKPAETTPVE